jgi:hypothetical protein
MGVNQKYILGVESTYDRDEGDYKNFTEKELEEIAQLVFIHFEKESFDEKIYWNFSHSDFGNWDYLKSSLNGNTPCKLILDAFKRLSKQVPDVILMLYVLEEHDDVHVSVTNALNGIITREKFFRMPLFTDLVVKYDLSPYIRNLVYPLVKSACSK